MHNKAISFIFCYARSGGTFFNRYLNNFNELIVLSEAHPINTENQRMKLTSIAEQAKFWYGIEVKSNEYIEQITEIKQWCDQHDKYLVIRDWSYIDFARSYLNDFQPPETSVNIKLLKQQFDVNEMAFVRDGIDVYLSQGQALNQFAKEYLSFIQYIKNRHVKVFKYEDFVDDSSHVFSELCHWLQLPDLKLVDKQAVSSQKVMGDINTSRGNVHTNIVKLKRRYAGYFKRQLINGHSDLIEANNLLEYPATYESKESERFKAYVFFEINKIRKYYPKRMKELFTKVKEKFRIIYD